MLVFSYSSGTNEMRARERQDVAEGRDSRGEKCIPCLLPFNLVALIKIINTT